MHINICFCCKDGGSDRRSFCYPLIHLVQGDVPEIRTQCLHPPTHIKFHLVLV